MKKSNVINFLMLVVFVAFISACSKSDSSSAPDCEHCHIALPNPAFNDTCDCPDEWAWEIESPSNGHNFCGDELVTAEAVGYTHTITEMLINDDGDTLMPGTYGPGSANPAHEIHCGEHDED